MEPRAGPKRGKRRRGQAGADTESHAQPAELFHPVACELCETHLGEAVPGSRCTASLGLSGRWKARARHIGFRKLSSCRGAACYGKLSSMTKVRRTSGMLCGAARCVRGAGGGVPLLPGGGQHGLSRVGGAQRVGLGQGFFHRPACWGVGALPAEACPSYRIGARAPGCAWAATQSSWGAAQTCRALMRSWSSWQ